MPTVIDELVVKLGLDAKNFQRGQADLDKGLNRTRKGADKTARDVEQSGKRAAEFFGQMERAALKFFAVFTLGRGFVDFTRTVVATGANLSRLSRNIGLSTDTLSRWGDAVRKNGGSAEGFQSTLQTISSAITDIKVKGDSSLIPFFQVLGVSLDDGTGKAKKLDALLLDVGEGLRSRFPNREDAFNFARQFGLDEGTINLLMQGRAEVNKMLAQQKGFSATQAKAAEDAERRWLDVQSRIESVTRELVIKLLPAIEKLAGAMAKFAEVSVPALTTAVDWFSKLHDATGGVSTALIGILATLRLIGGVSLLGAAAQVTGVGSAAAAATGMLRGMLGRMGALGLFFGGPGLGNSDRAGVAEQYGEKLTQEEADEFERTGRLPDRLKTWSPIKGAPSASSGGRVPRGIRNNNPGNLEFRGQRGAAPEAGSGRFAAFGTMAEGVAALGRQLQLYGKRGADTLREIIGKWAPSNENDTGAYISRMQKLTGFSADQPLNMNDAGTMALLIRGITSVENGSNFVGRNDLLEGLQQLRAAPAAGAQPISIGQITIVTQSTDAQGIARDVRQALVRQADTGMR